MSMLQGYLGSKAASGASEAIIARMPPHDTYIEAFLGTGVVARRKPAAAKTYVVDRDLSMVASFRCGYEICKHAGRAEAFIAGFDYAGSGRTFIYADPPYVLSTRTSRHRYRFDFTDDDHVRLAEVLHVVPADVAISGYASRLYDSLYASWRKVSFQVMTRGGPRTECVWMNYAAGDTVISGYAGLNFTDRQRIKRKVARWSAKFDALPVHERQLILAELLQRSTIADPVYPAGRGVGAVAPTVTPFDFFPVDRF